MICSILYGAINHTSVPLNHKVYSVIKSAEIRGIITNPINVRPYSNETILSYLEIIEKSNQITNDELSEIILLKNEFTRVPSDNTPKSLAKSGTFYSYNEKLDFNTYMGVKLNFDFTHSLTDLNKYDSRNGGDIFIQGDFKNFVSLFMNIGLRFDHLDPRLFLYNDFKIPSKGKYDTFWDHDGEHLLYYGIYASPEVSSSFLEGKVQARWASIERDWGVGQNNLMLSGSAQSMNAFEISVEFSTWLRYAFIAGSLGKFDANVLDNYEEFYSNYHFSDNLKTNKYANNFSAHRVEIGLPWNITFGIFESVVYGKRFEFGYLNPLSILMYEQNIMGDLDNMLAGFDLQWTLPKYLRAYVSAATTEMNEINPKRFFTAPRNILGMQAGIDVNIPFLSYTTATLQYTYLGPFFYTHRPVQESRIIINDNGDAEQILVTTQELSMVNEGRNIGYPLRPNSDEFLFSINYMLKNNWDGSLTVKYQRRSGQYGFNIDKFMYYSAAKNDAYDDKNFNAYLFEKNIGIEAKINKTLNNLPIRFSVSYILNMTTNRGTPTPVEAWDIEKGTEIAGYDPEGEHKDYYLYPVTKYFVSGNWKPWQFSNAISLRAEICF